jgi:hypothetical protein
MDRRTFVASLVVAVGSLLAFSRGEVAAGPRARRRRRIRRRHRRRVVRRIVHGRHVWVVPVGLAVGWELVHEDRVVIVKETKFIEKEGATVEVVVVEDKDGKAEEIEIVREDTADNRKELEGSEVTED